MSGELDAAGALATAGLAAGALEGREPGAAGEGACLNCGATLAGRFCAHCGQAAHPHRSVAHMAEELLHGVFHFDTKVWRTLPMLAFRPGTLTRNYVYGKRARYISPLALFLLTVFLMFFVFAYVELPFNVETRADTPEMTAADLAEARSGLAAAQQQLAAAEAAPEEKYTPGLGVRLARQAVELAQAEVTRREQALQNLEPNQNAAEGAAAPAAAGQNPAPSWQEQLSTAARNGKIRINTPSPHLNARIRHSLENPDLALYKIQQAAYKYSFLLVPISLPFMWLLFIWRRGLTLYDHAVFTLYGLSFASVLFVVLALVVKVPWLAWLGGVLVGVGLPVQMLFHLKGAYALGWWSAIWRSLLLYMFSAVSLSVFIAVIFLLGLGG